LAWREDRGSGGKGAKTEKLQALDTSYYNVAPIS
jgi:hypothetical protein